LTVVGGGITVLWMGDGVGGEWIVGRGEGKSKPAPSEG
jgi:hypothetical protein